MRITYINRRSDLVLFNAAHQFMSPGLQVIFILFAVLIGFSARSQDFLVIGLLGVVAYCVMWAAHLAFLAMYVGLRKNPTVLTQHTLELQEGALLEETAFNKSLFYWSGVTMPAARPGFVAIYVAAGLAHVIPNRAFRSRAHRLAFVQEVRARIGAAAT